MNDMDVKRVDRERAARMMYGTSYVEGDDTWSRAVRHCQRMTLRAIMRVWYVSCRAVVMASSAFSA